MQPAGPSATAVVFACEMIDDEVLLALDRLGGMVPSRPLIWLESGLHDRPEKLRDHIQALLRRLDEAHDRGEVAGLPSIRPGRGPASERTVMVEVPPTEEVLLAMGYCGNGLQGLVSATARLVFPRVDDCISLFLNHGCRRADIARDAHAFYLTKGWLSHNNAFLDSHTGWETRFGKERALQLRKASLAAYRRFTLIDTGAYDVAAHTPRVEELAGELDLHATCVPGSIQLLERLFAGPWDEEIVVVPPGRAITILDLFGSD